MSDLSELYQALILDHKQHPRHFGALADANRKADGYNPFCGDRFTVYVDVENGEIEDIGVEGEGCAISTASASMMAEEVLGKSVEEAEERFEQFRRMMADTADDADYEALGDLEAFAGVRRYPTRIKCANLAWHTLHAALTNQETAVSTEA